MRFSQRIGENPVKNILQVESIDEDLRNRLWNVILEDFFYDISDINDRLHKSERANSCELIIKEFFKKPVDTVPRHPINNIIVCYKFIEFLREWFYKAEWYEVYDFIEFLSQYESAFLTMSFSQNCNLALEKEVSGYRIINEKIVQITSAQEIQAIEEATQVSEKWDVVNKHLGTALNMLADRKNPDYRNSIKESISAVEALCIIFTGSSKVTLGIALAEIEKKYAIHNALKKAFSALYGYTSDANGIRHALVEEGVKVKFEDAKFMLVSCSAFISYLQSKIKT